MQIHFIGQELMFFTTMFKAKIHIWKYESNMKWRTGSIYLFELWEYASYVRFTPLYVYSPIRKFFPHMFYFRHWCFFGAVIILFFLDWLRVYLVFFLEILHKFSIGHNLYCYRYYFASIRINVVHNIRTDKLFAFELCYRVLYIHNVVRRRSLYKL